MKNLPVGEIHQMDGGPGMMNMDRNIFLTGFMYLLVIIVARNFIIIQLNLVFQLRFHHKKIFRTLNKFIFVVSGEIKLLFVLNLIININLNI